MVDHALIKRLLAELAAIYPNSCSYTEIAALPSPLDDNGEKMLFYLAEHGLINMPINKRTNGNYSVGRITITVKGIDFLQEDGGLSALAAPVVRISVENIAAVIDAALVARGTPDADRSLVQKALGVAGPEVVKGFVQRLLDVGISHTPDILTLLRLS